MPKMDAWIIPNSFDDVEMTKRGSKSLDDKTSGLKDCKQTNKRQTVWFTIM